jgi:hypothetical protein
MTSLSYEVVDDGRGIHCLRCGRTSYHPADVRERYCGACHTFHIDEATPAPRATP